MSSFFLKPSLRSNFKFEVSLVSQLKLANVPTIKLNV